MSSLLPVVPRALQGNLLRPPGARARLNNRKDLLHLWIKTPLGPQGRGLEREGGRLGKTQTRRLREPVWPVKR